MEISKEAFEKQILADYKLACLSREVSYMGRREVLTGKAKFGIFGDGKELPQIALAKQFQNGDFRSGYYRDQTLMMAIDALTVSEFFAQLYAHTSVEAEPASAGRSMNGHFATRSIDENGNWKNLMEMKNSSADISPTAGQMSRLVGLAQASKVYRNNKDLAGHINFSNNGNEIVFATIGDASTSEGQFFESINAIGVLQVPAVISVWDDGHGISVAQKYQTTKESISEVLKGFAVTKNKPGYEIMTVKGWDYPSLVTTYEQAAKIAREEHRPVLVHVKEVTQPQGHSTSGSHERYKSKERLQWEQEYCCIVKFREWILEHNLSSEEVLEGILEEAKQLAKEGRKEAWSAFLSDLKKEKKEALDLLEPVVSESKNKVFIEPVVRLLEKNQEPIRKEILSTVKEVLRSERGQESSALTSLKNWLTIQNGKNYDRYNSLLHSNSENAALNVTQTAVELGENQEDGRVVLRENFDAILKKYPEVLIFGEDSGKIGGVNQGLEGLQEKYGELRVSDTGIRENTIIGQGIGMALRGLRPIAEIQYLDYLLYAIQVLSDDLATLQYRTKGGQKAPLIIRTRGHRLEGIWHSGSPMGMIINAVRGMYVCVPRNMVTAAGMYNTLLKSDDPAIVIEPLNGYRTKEPMPTNLGEYTVPLGKIDTVVEGTDITVISYGATCNLVVQAAKELNKLGISIEVLDIQTLLPFDVEKEIVRSLEKTNKVVFVDEDVPGGATAFMMQKVLEDQGGYQFLDAAPKTLTAKAHRPAYGTDGDYFSKPSIDDIVDVCYEVMREYAPNDFPMY